MHILNITEECTIDNFTIFEVIEHGLLWNSKIDCFIKDFNVEKALAGQKLIRVDTGYEISFNYVYAYYKRVEMEKICDKLKSVRAQQPNRTQTHDKI